VRFAHDRVDRTGLPQCGTLVEGLAHGHEEASRQSLARDVADEEEQTVVVEREEVVEVAAHLARGLEKRVEIEPRVTGKRGRRIRQAAHLDPTRRFELAREASGLLALLLDLAAQRLALPSVSAKVTTSIAVNIAPSASDGDAASNSIPPLK
jgi:hypothetical protein